MFSVVQKLFISEISGNQNKLGVVGEITSGKRCCTGEHPWAVIIHYICE